MSKKNNGAFALGFWLGTAIGAVSGLVLTRKETRQQIGRSLGNRWSGSLDRCRMALQAGVAATRQELDAIAREEERDTDANAPAADVSHAMPPSTSVPQDVSAYESKPESSSR